ncbi:MAG: hypothetical protein JSW59_18225 [Phycisphaerales bacterium]|nr:MAG: hypothetical protein JSW59_18225 [Phycisphaerales bacterium]
MASKFQRQWYLDEGWRCPVEQLARVVGTFQRLLSNGVVVRTEHGLSPIEATAVVAMALLVISILMPAMRKVKEQRDMTKCLANLGQWNPIISTYVEDNDGRFFSGYGNDNSWWVARLEDCHQSRMKNNLWFCPKAAKPLYDEQHNRADSFSIFQAWGIYTKDFNGHPDLSPDGIAGSYGLNGYLLHNETATNPTSENGAQDGSSWGILSNHGAENIPLFVEALRFDVRPQKHEGPANIELAAWSGNQMARCCINRHVGFESVSFCDFSARRVGLKELWTLKWHRKFDTSGPWTKAGGVQTANWPQWIRPFKNY